MLTEEMVDGDVAVDPGHIALGFGVTGWIDERHRTVMHVAVSIPALRATHSIDEGIRTSELTDHLVIHTSIHVRHVQVVEHFVEREPPARRVGDAGPITAGGIATPGVLIAALAERAE